MDLPTIVTIIANIAATLGIPLAIMLFINEKRRERRDREYGTYNALDDKYIAFLQLCIDHPELNLYSIALESEVELSPQQKIQQYAMYEVLISLLERGFLMYRDQSTEVKRQQWIGWESYLQNWCKNKSFQDLWYKVDADEYDTDFVAFVYKQFTVPPDTKQMLSPQQVIAYVTYTHRVARQSVTWGGVLHT